MNRFKAIVLGERGEPAVVPVHGVAVRADRLGEERERAAVRARGVRVRVVAERRQRERGLARREEVRVLDDGGHALQGATAARRTVFLLSRTRGAIERDARPVSQDLNAMAVGASPSRGRASPLRALS